MKNPRRGSFAYYLERARVARARKAARLVRRVVIFSDGRVDVNVDERVWVYDVPAGRL